MKVLIIHLGCGNGETLAGSHYYGLDGCALVLQGATLRQVEIQ